jgi:hypothetical protein
MEVAMTVFVLYDSELGNLAVCENLLAAYRRLFQHATKVPSYSTVQRYVKKQGWFIHHIDDIKVSIEKFNLEE